MNVIAVLSKFTRHSNLRILKNLQISLATRYISNDSSSTEEKPIEDEQYEKNIRHKILKASLPFVHDLGWTQDALQSGAESLGYPGITHGLFLKGGIELVHYFYTECNQSLAQQLKKETEGNHKIIPSEFIQRAVETRLRMILPYKKKWPQAIAMMTLPQNVHFTLASLLTLVDDICFYAGDRSVDFKWYSRRIALGGLYKTTELYLIQDKSEDHKQTWEFLARRIEELFKIHAILKESEVINNTASETFNSAFATARHMLGINWTR